MGTIIKCCNVHIILGNNKKRMKSVYLLEIKKTHWEKKKYTISQWFSNMFIYCNQMKIFLLKHTIVVYWILFHQIKLSTRRDEMKLSAVKTLSLV